MSQSINNVKPATQKAPRGIVFYDGPSLLDGKPILGIALSSTTNSKTGDLMQTYIIKKDMHPQDAINDGSDDTICGKCIHRKTGNKTGKRTCYVFPPAIGQVFKAFIAEKYANITEENQHTFRGRKIRFGAYGDPAAIPAKVWRKLLAISGENHTSYTHLWERSNFDIESWKNRTMASVETLTQKAKANALGLNTFRVGTDEDKVQRDEMICPASKELGKRLQCEDCMVCSGGKKNVFILAHGTKGTAEKYKANLA